MPNPILLEVLVERSGDWWVAQCLQLNIAAQARSLPELFDQTVQMIAGHFQTAKELGTDPFRRKAPPEVWERYNAAKIATHPVDLDRVQFELPQDAHRTARVETRIAA